MSLQAEGLTVARIPVQVRVRAPRIELDPPELRLEVASGENRLVVLRLHNAGDWDLIVTRLESKAPWLRLEGGHDSGAGADAPDPSAYRARRIGSGFLSDHVAHHP